jgi:hypothetical protein
VINRYLAIVDKSFHSLLEHPVCHHRVCGYPGQKRNWAGRSAGYMHFDKFYDTLKKITENVIELFFAGSSNGRV